MSTGKVDPDTLALRAPPRPVTRLNRRMLVAVVAVLVTLVFGVTLWSLQRNVRMRDAATELHNVDRIARADGLDQLPPDYSKLAQPKPPEPPRHRCLFWASHCRAIWVTRCCVPSAAIPDSRIPGLGTPTPPDPSLQAARAEQLAREREAEDAAKAPLFFRASQRQGGCSVCGQCNRCIAVNESVGSAQCAECTDPSCEQWQWSKFAGREK